MRTQRFTLADWAILLVTPILAYALGSAFDLAEQFEVWMEAHEAWELDELLIMPLFFSIALIVVLVRQVRALDKAAYSDMLTGLPNRRAFDEALEERAATGYTLMFMDLDGFKVVNDRYGHRRGDDLLEASARRLEAALPPEALISRFGGDEFCVLLPAYSSAEPALELADHIVAVLKEPADPTEPEFSSITASIGIVIAPAGAAPPEDPIRDADFAMYVAKRAGKAQAIVFDDEMRPDLPPDTGTGRLCEATG